MSDMSISSGLVPDTNILIDTEIKPIEVTSITTGNNGFQTYGVIDNKVILTNIHKIPVTIYAKDIVKLEFSNGYHLNCIPNTQILSVNGYMTALDLTYDTTSNDKEPVDIMCYKYDNEKGFTKSYIKVTHAEKTVALIDQSIYVTHTDCGNLLLPYVKDGSNSIEFICIYQ